MAPNTDHTVTFTKAQFLNLMKSVYLGNWVANACRTVDKKEEYEEIEDFIFSLAPQFGFSQYVDHEESDGDRYYPTRRFKEETDVEQLVEEYNEENMREELIDVLGDRDFFEKYSEAEIEKMSQKERFIKRIECEEKYGEEFEYYGVDRLKIQE